LAERDEHVGGRGEGFAIVILREVFLPALCAWFFARAFGGLRDVLSHRADGSFGLRSEGFEKRIGGDFVEIAGGDAI